MHVVWTSSAKDVVDQVAVAVRDLQDGHPLRRVYVLTPPGSTAATLRRLLPSTVARHGVGATPVTGIAGIRFTTIPDLALELAPAGIRAGRPITPLLLSAAVQAQLDRHCPVALADVKDHPATVDALVQVANRLRSIRLAEPLGQIVGALAGHSAVRRAIVEVAVNARASLLRKGFRDEASLLAAASAALTDGSTHLGGPLVVVATDAVHPAQMPFVEQLIRSIASVRVVASRPEPSDADFIGQLTRLVGEPQLGGAPAAVHAVSSPDQDEEARWVVRRIVSMVTGSLATIPEDIVVLYPPGSGYARSLREELQRAGVFTSGPAIETLAGSMAGQAVRLLIGLMLDGCDRDRVLHLASVAPIWPSQAGRRRDVARWRRLCRQANIVVADDWGTAVDRLRLAQRASRLRRQRSDPTFDVDIAGPRDEADLRSMESLVGLVRTIQRSAGAFAKASTWQSAAAALLDELARHIGTLQWRLDHWADVPVWQRRAGEQVEVMLTALRQFDSEDTKLMFSAPSLRRIIAAELDQQVRKAGDTTVGVRLLPLQHGSCTDARHIFITGANEGVLPPGRTEDLVIPSELTPACAAVLEHGDWQRHRLRRAWYASIGSTADVTVTLARTDLRRGGELFASQWLGTIEPTQHASHRVGVMEMAALTAGECAARRSGDADSASASSTLHRRALALASRSQSAPTVFDGLIGHHPEHDPYDRVQSITNFETHATCGLQYFITKVLRVDTDVDASEITEIQARERGIVVHSVLEQLVVEWLGIDPTIRAAWMQGDQLDRSIARAAALLDEAAVRLDAEHKLGHATSWSIERSMILAAISDTLRVDAQQHVTPVAVEYRFGDDGGNVGAYPVDVPGPARVVFQGSVDRIDRVGDHLRVTDFKTSNAAKARTTSRAEIEAGSKLQPSLYSAVVRAHSDLFAGNDHVGGDGSAIVAWQYVYLRRGRVEPKVIDAALLDILSEPVAATAARLSNGDFKPAIAGDFRCLICTPDGLGRGDVDARVQQWNVFAAEQRAAQDTDMDTDTDAYSTAVTPTVDQGDVE